MKTNFPSSSEMGKQFSEKYWEHWPELFQALNHKYQDRSYVLKGVEETNPINRAVLTFDYFKENLPPGAKIIDMACGIGFNTCFANRLGFNASGFDASEKGIERARKLVRDLGQGSDIFVLGDHTHLEKLSDASIDGAMAMGFFRYLSPEDVAYCYREIHRVLKPGGIFAVTNQNLLFEAFALNDGALRFWAKIMADFSPVDELLGKSVLDALEEHVRVPQRKYDQRSVSQTITPYSENPLTYRETAAKFGFELEKILFPDNNLLPSFLENTLDQEKLWAMKSRVCLKDPEDWRGFFMDYEFLAFLTKH